jgi:hypothetical protein
LENDQTLVDAILYTRRGNGKKKGAAISAPKSWMEWFEKRPDWWGQAKRIEFMDYIYEIAEETAVPDAAEAPEGVAAEQG